MRMRQNRYCSVMVAPMRLFSAMKLDMNSWRPEAKIVSIFDEASRFAAVTACRCAGPRRPLGPAAAVKLGPGGDDADHIGFMRVGRVGVALEAGVQAFHAVEARLAPQPREIAAGGRSSSQCGVLVHRAV